MTAVGFHGLVGFLCVFLYFMGYKVGLSGLVVSLSCRKEQPKQKRVLIFYVFLSFLQISAHFTCAVYSNPWSHRRVPLFYVLRVYKHGSIVYNGRFPVLRRHVGLAGLSLRVRRFCFVCSCYQQLCNFHASTTRVLFLGSWPVTTELGRRQLDRYGHY